MDTTQVSVLLNDAKWSTFSCELLETILDQNGRKFVRIKFPDGDIKRVYHDRIRPFTDKQPEESPMTTESEQQYNPWADHKDADIYERSSDFTTTTACKTIAIIDVANGKWYNINTYNGVAKAGKMEYPITDLKKLVHKLEKKGYKKLTKDSSATAK